MRLATIGTQWKYKWGSIVEEGGELWYFGMHRHTSSSSAINWRIDVSERCKKVGRRSDFDNRMAFVEFCKQCTDERTSSTRLEVLTVHALRQSVLRGGKYPAIY